MQPYNRRNVIVVLAACLTVAVAILAALLVIGPPPRHRTEGPAMAWIPPVRSVAAAPNGTATASTVRTPVNPAKRQDAPGVADIDRANMRPAQNGVSPRSVAVGATDSQRSVVEAGRSVKPGKTAPVGEQVLVERFGKAIVRIELQRDGETRGIGSGFIVSPDGFVLTNYHVIDSPDGARSLVVRLSSGEPLPVRAVVATDRDRDLAVLSVNGQNLPTIRLGDLDIVRPGEEIVVIGRPVGPSNSVSAGVVSGIQALPDGRQLFEVTAQVAPDHSGGPVFNAVGDVIGIVALKIQGHEGREGVVVCIPVRDVIPIVQGLPHVKAG